ncbi:MAG: metallophosphoesterase family protein [Candidatus Hodarchaeales archaeon]|jgi:protein phosphatase
MDIKKPHLEQPNLPVLRKLTEQFIDLYSDRPNVIIFENKAKTMIVGDLHGDLSATKRIFRIAHEKSCERLIFLGDYVDRGPNQLAVLEFVLKMSLENLDKVIPLRGNHEDQSMNRDYGFLAELDQKFPNPSDFQEAVDLTIELYDYLPLAVQTPHSLLLHGGIPENATLEDIKEIPKPHSRLMTFRRSKAEKLYRILWELQWNDPDENLPSGFSHSRRGRRSRTFSCKAAEAFLNEISSNMRLFRSHESSRGPFGNLWDGLVVHIYSTASTIAQFLHSGNDEGAVAIDNEDGSVDILNLTGTRIASLPPK